MSRRNNLLAVLGLLVISLGRWTQHASTLGSAFRRKGRGAGVLCLLLLEGCTIRLGVTPSRDEEPATRPSTVVMQHVASTSDGDKAAAVVNQWCASTSRIVTTANPTPITVRDEKAKALRNLTDATQTFGVGDSCQTGAGWWQGIGVLPDPLQNKVLVRYWNPSPRPYYFSCSDKTLFTLDIDDFLNQCLAAGTPAVRPKDEGTKRQQEKTLIEQTLKAAGQ